MKLYAGAGRNDALERRFAIQAFDDGGRVQIERPDGSVQRVTAPVAEHARAEVVERPPFVRVVTPVERPLLRRPNPQVPRQPFGHW